MESKKGGFEDKFLSKLGKIDPRRIRDYLTQLLSRKNFFETIFDHLGEGVIVTDPLQRIIYTNRIARAMLQWSPRKAVLGETLAESCPPGELKEILSAMLRHPRRIEGYECAFGPAGERRLTLTAINVRPPEQESPAHGSDEKEPLEAMWVFILADATEHRRRVEEQSRSQRLASLALLTSGVAHEIKNPLNSLNIHAQILSQETREARSDKRAIDPARVERATRVILEETSRLTEVINEFIQAARPQSPTVERKFVNRLIEDLARLFAGECERAGIELRLDLEPELPPVEMDAHLIFQALRNLVRNAIEAHAEARALARKKKTKHEPLPPMILVRTHLSGDQINIEVADNGPGIAEENIDKIFEPYYTTKEGGTGLGLMVVYRVVTEHKGAIHVDSKPGVGSRFVITLPLVERPVRLLDSPVNSPALSVT